MHILVRDQNSNLEVLLGTLSESRCRVLNHRFDLVEVSGLGEKSLNFRDFDCPPFANPGSFCCEFHFIPNCFMICLAVISFISVWRGTTVCLSPSRTIVCAIFFESELRIDTFGVPGDVTQQFSPFHLIKYIPLPF